MKTSLQTSLAAAALFLAVGLTVAIAAENEKTAKPADVGARGVQDPFAAADDDAATKSAPGRNENAGGDPFAATAAPRKVTDPTKLLEGKKALYRQLQKFMFFQLKRHSPAEEKIMAALDEETQLDLVETPLGDVMNFLQDLHAIPIVLDRRALEDCGVSLDEPITLNLNGISLRSALRLMLTDLDLDYVIKNEVMSITTKEVADSTMETVVYSLHHLEYEAEALAELIEKTIGPRLWRTNPDGEKRSGEALGAIAALGETIVVTHNQHTHGEIVDLFEQLHRQKSTAEEFRELMDRLKKLD